jgi:hypothetical protein
MVIRMQFKPNKLGITQLELSLFSHSLKVIQGTFRNSPSIPEPARWAALPTCSDWRPTTNRSTDIVGVSWRF